MEAEQATKLEKQVLKNALELKVKELEKELEDVKLYAKQMEESYANASKQANELEKELAQYKKVLDYIQDFFKYTNFKESFLNALKNYITEEDPKFAKEVYGDE